MTALDVAVLALLLLIGLGGYRQGLLRGLTRLAALLSATLLALLLGPRTPLRGALRLDIARLAVLFLGLLIATGTLAWLANRAISEALHTSRLNRALGVLPALALGLLVLAVLLGLAQRLAPNDALASYIAGGRVSGPLAQPFFWLERRLAGLP
ncbi:CvpA family protein [Kallotenue papyrolyticum]|uniref:CvpA family protein n=1 Tax=Kallotenue papyrolyticum TaxID=1325125 RepID=UPI0004924418|nr:CvpA family protein [Kallotenue papyrolyticum]